MSVSAIIPSAGAGSRIGFKKQFAQLNGKPLICHTISPFEESEYIEEIIVVVGKEDINEAKQLIGKYNLKKIKCVVEGGKERQDSVYNGLQEVSENCKYIMIHDGARPLLKKETISSAVNEVKKFMAVVIGVPSKDTVKLVSKDEIVKETLDRDLIWLVQTPQIFEAKLIKEAYERAAKIGYKATDDSKLVERMGQTVKVVMGSYENIKVTTQEDLVFAETILKNRG